jgi:hypothetical protein
MKQRALVEFIGSQIFDHQCTGGERDRYPCGFQRVASQEAGAGHLRPDRGQMAFARSFRPDQQQGPRRPIWPMVDERERGLIGRPGEKVIASKAFGVTERKRKLTRGRDQVGSSPV